MNTRLLLSASAIVMAAAGIAGTFLPQELLRAIGAEPVGLLPLLVQLLAALLFAFGMANWVARGSLMGGIYNRPLALGNLTHFTIGALALLKAALSARDAVTWTLSAVYTLFAIGFALVFMTSPVSRTDT